ncbi:MAG TPA: hypothetical protein VI756_27330 [Blastocatellia bacterium]
MAKTVSLTTLVVFCMSVFAFGMHQNTKDCTAPALICKASSNQDRSLYVRDHSRYQQKIHVERFKGTDESAKQDEVRDTVATVQPDTKPDKTGRVPVLVHVDSDTDRHGNPRSRVDANESSFLSFGAVMDLAFFPLLPENLKYYDFQEVVAERKNEKWYRFLPKPNATDVPLASGVAELDPDTGEVLTIKIESLHNLDKLDKEARKLKSFYATIDYSQFEGALRMPTLASGGGISEIPRFQGRFKFNFEEAKYVLVDKVD